MYLAKITVLVFLTCLYTQVATVEESVPLAELYGEAMRLYAELKSVVNIEVAHALQELTALLSQISALAETTLLQAEHHLSLEKSKLESDLKEIKDSAQSNGIDYTSCTLGREDIILSLPDTVLSEIDSCVASLVSSGIGAASGAINRAMSVQQSINRLELSLNQCNNNDECLLNFIGKFAVDIVEVPIGIRENTDATIDVVKAIDRAIERCASDRDASVGLIGSIIMGEIRNCIDGL